MLLTITAISSLIHHAVEARYYQPSLIYCEPKIQWILLQNDRLQAIILIFSLGSIRFIMEEYPSIIVFFGFMILSEIVMFVNFLSFDTKRTLRTIFHAVWHMGSFAYLAVTRYREEPSIF